MMDDNVEVRAVEQEQEQEQEVEQEQEATFSSLGCDLRVLKGVMRMGLIRPTLVQSRCVPVALAGHDMLVSAHTGTGKTLAYAMPLLHTLLQHKDTSKPALAIVLVPTRDLCADATKTLSSLAHFCRQSVSIVSVSSSASLSCIGGSAVVMVGTPSRVLATLKEQKDHIDVEESLRMLVIDEADLVLSYGYDEDIDELLQLLPRRQHQTILLSATLTPQLDKLKSMALSRPAIVRLCEEEHEKHQADRLQQFVVECPEKDRYLMAYALLKLGPLNGKTLVFVNNATECFRLKLFLEGFSINAAVLNAELPANSRHRIVQEFNRGMFDMLIATDESAEIAGVQDTNARQEEVEHDTQDKDEEHEDVEEEMEKENAEKEKENESDDDTSDEDEGEDAAPKKSTEVSKQKKASDKKKMEFGVSRGVDFRDVANVFNMALPASLSSYVHRIGRTARGGRKGTAISLVVKEDEQQQDMLQQVKDYYEVEVEGETVAGIKDLPVSMELITAFRYRIDSVLSTVTARAVREARLKELRMEMLNSTRLRAHFEDRPRELALLKHDKVLRPNKVDSALSSIPTYLLPAQARAALEEEKGKPTSANRRGHKRSRKPHRSNRRKRDPLKSFSAHKSKRTRRK